MPEMIVTLIQLCTLATPISSSNFGHCQESPGFDDAPFESDKEVLRTTQSALEQNALHNQRPCCFASLDTEREARHCYRQQVSSESSEYHCFVASLLAAALVATVTRDCSTLQVAVRPCH